MELKPFSTAHQSASPNLLIVPYGIETAEKVPEKEEDILLIVPYGIETY